MQYTQEEQNIIDQAIAIIESKIIGGDSINSPKDAARILKLKLATKPYEVFAIVFLNTQNVIICIEEMFRGTIDQAAVYVREIAKQALDLNARSVILAHNHPSGKAEPSQADQRLTSKICEALALFDIKVLDHIIITNDEVFCFTERGLL